MQTEDLPYVVATGEVTVWLNESNPHSIKSINQLIDDLARKLPDQVAVGMPAPCAGDLWVCQNLTYGELHKASIALAKRLHDENLVSARTREQGTSQLIVAMLASSSLDFLIHWLALLRLGYGGLLIAPQSSPEAVVNLLQSTQAISMLYDERTSELAKEVAAKCDIRLIPMKASTFDCSSLPEEVPSMPRALSYEEESDTLAIIFHTSGSTGMPKPIYQKHSVWTKALPIKPGPAAFTTTPLYHGGAADLLRAMMSQSILYLYTPLRPITASNVCASLKACQVKYFLAVPYVLKMLAENEDTRELLSRMDMISVGGAPLPEEIGNELVRTHGWKLVSRMGSSECGFLMSSWRDFENDTEWSYLRDVGQEKMLQFESQADDLAELVVDKDWPSLNTSNRPDGRFATGDLYEKHSSTPHAWRYFGRADDLLVLLNGEKVSPAPMEQIFKSDPRISECLIYGQNRPAVCCLLFPSPDYCDLEHGRLLEDLEATMKKANDAAPSFGQISKEMVAFVSDGSDLPKTSKGTIQKKKAEQVYSKIIEELYDPTSESTTSGKKFTKDQLDEHLRSIVLSSSQVKEESLNQDSDFFSLGVNSLQASRIRSQIKSTVNLNGQDLASNVVFEYPSIESLAGHVFSLQENQSSGAGAQQPDVLDTMRQMAESNAKLIKAPSSPKEGAKRSKVSGKVLLTGSTGALGAHLLHQLLQLPDVLQVYCLCRAQDDEDAMARTKKSLQQRGFKSVDMSRVTCLASDLSKEDLGLSSKVYSDLSGIDVVTHCAWAVNFSWTLRSFEGGQIRGLVNLINLSMRSDQPDPLFLFCSSIASVLNPNQDSPAVETPSSDPVDSAQMGYAQSKWVAEQLCSEASRKGLDVIVYRLGQLCGDTESGIWNETEGWPLLIKSAEPTGCLPQINDNPSWLPVDIAARAMFDLVAEDRSDTAFHHIYNPDTSVDWSQILEYLHAAGLQFNAVESKEWLRKLEAINKSADEVPSLGLLDLWKSAYGSDKASPGREVSTTKAMQSGSLKDAGPITQELVQKFVTAWRATGFLQ